MEVKAIFGVCVLCVFIILAVAGIVLNHKEYNSNTSGAQQTGDFTKGYVCIFSFLIIAAGFIVAKAVDFC